jgi:hypothetical protein
MQTAHALKQTSNCFQSNQTVRMTQTRFSPSTCPADAPTLTQCPNTHTHPPAASLNSCGGGSNSSNSSSGASIQQAEQTQEIVRCCLANATRYKGILRSGPPNVLHECPLGAYARACVRRYLKALIQCTLPYTCMYVFVSMYAYIYVCMHVCMYVYIYSIHINTHTHHTHTHTQLRAPGNTSRPITAATKNTTNTNTTASEPASGSRFFVDVYEAFSYQCMRP